MLRETQTQDYAISLPQTLQKDDGLKGAQFDYSTEENALQTAALYARTSSGENKILFYVFVLQLSNLHYTRHITPKRVTSDGAHLHDLASGQHSCEETS